LAGVAKLNAETLTVGFNNQNADFAGTVTGTLANGQDQFVKIGTGRQTLSGTNTFTGDAHIQAGTLVLKNGQALANSVAVVLDNVAGAVLELATSETIGSLAGGGTLGGNAVLLGNVLTVGSNSLSTQFDGVVSGSLTLGTAQFVKIGAGILTLTGTNTFTGDVNIQGGMLNLVNGQAIANSVAVVLDDTANVVLNLTDSETIGSLAGGAASKVQLNGRILSSGTNNTTTSYAGVISGSLGLNVTQFVKQGSGTLTLSGANTFNGDVQIQGGTLNLVGGAAINDQVAVKLDNTVGVVLNLTDTETIGSLNGGTLSLVKLNGKTLYSGINGNTTTYAGIISGSIALNSPTAQFVKQGTGTLTLSGTNTFTGDVQISGGTLNLVGGGAIKDTVAVILDNSANAVLNLTSTETIGSLAGGAASKVQLNGQVLTSGTNNNTTNYAGVISGSLALGTTQFVKQGTGTLTLSGSNTFTGDVRIEAGTLDLSGGSALFDNVAVTLLSAANVRLNLSTSETIGSLAGVGPNGLVSLNAQTLTVGSNNTNTEYGGVMSGSLTSAGTNLIKIGSGTQTLSGVNTFTGNVYISAGTLDLKGGSALADTVGLILANFSTANLNLTNSERIGSLAGGGLLGGNVSLNTNTLTIGGTNTSTTYAGVISGAGALVKEGTGTTTLTGSSTFTGGTTVAVGTLALSAAGKLNDAGNVAVTSGATYDISQASSGRTLALLSGSGGVRVGANTLTLGAAADSEFSGTINTGGISNVAGGKVVKAGAGVFTLSGTSNVQTVDVNLGTFKLAGSNNNLTSTTTVNVASGATLALANQNTIGTLNASGNLVAALAGGSLTATTYNLNGATVGLNLGTGTVNGSGNVTVTSALNATQINITGGTFKLGLGSSLSSAAAVNVSAGALLSLDGIAATQNRVVINALSGFGAIYQGTALLSITGVSTFAGTITSSPALTSGSSSATAIISGDLTVTGSTGTTDVQVASGGTVRLTGNSKDQVQGGLNVDSGGILMISGSSGINSTDVVVNSGSLMNQGTVKTTDTVTNSGTLQNSGAVTGGSLINSGLLTNSGSLNGGSLTNTGTINNAGGIVTVSGSTALTNSGMFVNNGTVTGAFTSTGTLTGTGSISGNANVTGTFSPGNSPGEARFGGSIVELGGLVTITAANFEVAGTNNLSNAAAIAGTNALFGGTSASAGVYFDQVNMVNNGKVVIGSNVELNLSGFVADAGSLNIATGQKFKIVKTADGSISGVFSRIKTALLASSGAQSYALNKGVVFNTWTGELVGTGVAWITNTWDISVDLLPTSLGGWSGLNSNQKAMLTQLNVGERQFHGGDLVPLLLAAPNAEAARLVLDKASPEAYAGFGDYALQVGRFHAQQALSMNPLISEGRWALFGGYAGYNGGSKSSLNRADYDLQSNAGLTGVRLALGRGFDVGLFAGVDTGKVRSTYTNSNVDGQTFGLTAGYNGGLSNPWAAALSISGGNFKVKGTRSTNLGTAKFDSASLSSVGAILEVSRKIVQGPKYGLMTDLSVSFTDASVGSFTENGAPSGEALAVQGQSPNSFIAELGLSGAIRASEQWTLNSRISLGHNFETASRDVTANVVGEPTRFTVRSSGMGVTNAAISLGTSYQFNKAFSVGANYRASFSSDAQMANSFYLNAGLSF
jgi:autotransporter-associated beta strand protein